MKLFTVVFLLIVVNYSQNFEISPESKVMRDECIEAEKVDIGLVMTAIEKIQFPDDRNYKCFLKCMMIKQKCMTESGLLLLDNIKKQEVPIKMSPEKLSALVDACKENQTADPCETAYNFSKCSAQQMLLNLTH